MRRSRLLCGHKKHPGSSHVGRLVGQRSSHRQINSSPSALLAKFGEAEFFIIRRLREPVLEVHPVTPTARKGGPADISFISAQIL
jgi:hypothetical protein